MASTSTSEQGTVLPVRDPKDGHITGVKVFVAPGRPELVQRFSTVMVETDPPQAKFVGYVRSFVETMERDDPVHVEMGWFYRACDIEDRLGDQLPSDWVKRAAKLGRVPGLTLTAEEADGGRFKELCLSNHVDTVSVNCILHPVWLLREDSIQPLFIPAILPAQGPGASLSGAAAAAYSNTLIPGFVCRRYWDRDKCELTSPLSKLLKQRAKYDSWVPDDLSELLRQSEAEREEFKRKWQQRVAAAARHQQGQGRGPGQGQGQPKKRGAGAG